MLTENTTRATRELDLHKVLLELEVPFSPNQVRWRVTNTTNDKKRGQIVPYGGWPTLSLSLLLTLWVPHPFAGCPTHSRVSNEWDREAERVTLRGHS